MWAPSFSRWRNEESRPVRRSSCTIVRSSVTTADRRTVRIVTYRFVSSSLTLPSRQTMDQTIRRAARTDIRAGGGTKQLGRMGRCSVLSGTATRQRAAASPSANPVGGTERQGVSLASLPLEAEAGRACAAARGGTDGHDRIRGRRRWAPSRGPRAATARWSRAERQGRRQASRDGRRLGQDQRQGRPGGRPLGDDHRRRQEGQDGPAATTTARFSVRWSARDSGHLHGARRSSQDERARRAWPLDARADQRLSPRGRVLLRPRAVRERHRVRRQR